MFQRKYKLALGLIKKTDNPEWRKLDTLPRSKRREICGRIEKIIEAKGVENCIRDANFSMDIGYYYQNVYIRRNM